MQQRNANTLETAKQLLSCFNEVEGFHQREQQVALLSVLVSGLEQGGQLMLEAPTGTGKTLAYLCGALALAQVQNKKVVIATGTVNLQTQLLEKDIPWFTEVTKAGFIYALAKGRGRFACINRLQGMVQEKPQEDLLDSNVVPLSMAGQETIARRMLQRIDDNSWSGDLDNWLDPLSSRMATRVVSTRESCPGKTCDNFARCAFQQMRQKIKMADVIIANHSLLLSDIDLGGGRLLPPMDECLYIVDEAHGLPRATLAHAAKCNNLEAFVGTLDFAGKLMLKLFQSFPQAREEFKGGSVEDAFRVVSATYQELQDVLLQSRFVSQLTQPGRDAQDMDVRLHAGEKITLFIKNRGETLLPSLEKLLKVFRTCVDWLKEADDTKRLPQALQHAYSLQLPAVVAELEAAVGYWLLFLSDDPQGEPRIARWLSLEKSKNNALTVVLHSSPSWAAAYLRENFWSRAWGVALVSATLRALGSFDYYRSLSGLDQDVPGEVFSSVLDYSRQARLVIPWLENVPGTSKDKAYFDEVAALLPALIYGETGSLVLFTSRAAMQQVHALLPSEFRGKVLMQGGCMGRSALLEAHKRRVSEGKGSVLFGLASFAEGVDLPGDLCRHVVITRIPFAPFNHPVSRNIKEWMGYAHFSKMMLPGASIRLIQACGRLLRNEDDSGQITILDRRLQLKSYGKTLLQHLPAYQLQVENTAMQLVDSEWPEQSAGGALVY